MNPDGDLRKIKPEPRGTKKGKERAQDESPRASKRARKHRDDDDDAHDEEVNGQNDKSVDEEDDERDHGKPAVESDSDGDDDSGASSSFVRDAEGYVAGSIVRIALENFVTYDKVEFCPGPSLNMVIGPNGTGKSTIACAIAIGLGFPAKVLGRSTNISAYVKDGEKTGWTEIELKAHGNAKNPVIRRYLTKIDDKSRFTLNGASATAKEISKVMEKLNVQVGNLCTFLPQDRVASFAGLSPPDLLKETQKAAGDRRLSDWHTTLIQKRRAEVDMAKELETKVESLKRKKDKQADTEREVKQNEARVKLDFELAVLTLLVPHREYLDARADWMTAKQDRNALQTEIAELEQANKPFMDSMAALEACADHDNKLKKTLQARISKANKEVSEKVKTLHSCEANASKTREVLSNMRKNAQSQKVYIQSLQADVDKLATVIANKPDEPDYAIINDLMKEKNDEREALTDAIAELGSQRSELLRQLALANKDRERNTEQGKKLQDLNANAMTRCEKDDYETFVAIKWFRENKPRFKGRAYEPPRFTVQPKDKKHAPIAEAPVSRGAMRTFIFEEQEDYDLMMAEVNDRLIPGETNKIRINAVHYVGAKKVADIPRRFSEAQLKAWGFDCVAIDLLTGPELVLAWLCAAQDLARIPIALTSRPVDSKALESARGAVNRYYTPDGSNSIKFSKYGAGKALIEQRGLGRSWVFEQSEDTSKLAELKQRQTELQQQMQELKVKHDECTSREDMLKEQIKAIDREKSKLSDDKAKLGHPMKKWHAANSKYEAKVAELKKQHAKPSEEASRAKIKEDMLQLTEKRVSAALEYKDRLFKLAKLQLDSVEVGLRGLQFESDLRRMSTSNDEKHRELSERKAEHEQMVAKTSDLHKKAQELLIFVTELQNAADEEVAAEVGERGNDIPLADLRREQERVEAEISLTPSIAPHILKQFENRKIEIEHLQATVAEESAALDETADTIRSTEAKWLPKLQELISKVSANFSAAFDHLGLLGEIRISKDSDYDKWGIEILVAFRDGEALQVLTAQRQSGGERALTTVMYLMALAELSKSPFALVDEINQGMDQRVERGVHNALVKTTCKDDVGQYFLITPKLLPNLEYDPRMKVLIINNGDWLPAKLSLKDLVAKKVKRNVLAARQ